MKNRFLTGLGGVLMGAGIVGIVLTVYAADERLKTDGRGNAIGGGISNDAGVSIIGFRMDPVTKELLVKSGVSAGGATSANQLLILAQIAAGQTTTEPIVIAVGTTPTLLLSASAIRRGGTVQHMGTAIVFLGKGAVTTSTGIALRGGIVANDAKGQTATTDDGDALYGIVVSGTENVRVREVSD